MRSEKCCALVTERYDRTELEQERLRLQELEFSATMKRVETRPGACPNRSLSGSWRFLLPKLPKDWSATELRFGYCN